MTNTPPKPARFPSGDIAQMNPEQDINALVVEPYAPMADRDRRIKRLKFRANHRGMREMDILMGGFADAHCDAMTDDELEQLEFVLSIHDTELSSVLVHFAEPPAVLSVVPMFQRIVDYRNQRFYHKSAK